MSLEPSTAAAESRGDRLRGAAPAGLAGIGAAALGVGLGELAAAFLQTTASPIVAVGALLIDLAPPWAKDTAIALFGTADKIALIALVAVVLLVVAAVAGVLERRRPPWGRVLIGLIAAIGAVAVATRTPFSPLDTVPPLLAMVVAVLTLQFLAKTLFEAELRARQRASESELAAARSSAIGATSRAAAAGSAQATEATETPEISETTAVREATPPVGVDRRRFLIYAGASVVIGAIAAASGAALSAGTRAVTAVREAIALPKAAVKAAAVPAGAQFEIPGLPPVVTPNDEFYRIDTALSVPLVNPEGWSLRIHGLVDNEVTLTWDELLALPLEESITTLMCVSNEVGGGLAHPHSDKESPDHEVRDDLGHHRDDGRHRPGGPRRRGGDRPGPLDGREVLPCRRPQRVVAACANKRTPCFRTSRAFVCDEVLRRGRSHRGPDCGQLRFVVGSPTEESHP